MVKGIVKGSELKRNVRQSVLTVRIPTIDVVVTQFA
jgi:hypothetical protein